MKPVTLSSTKSYLKTVSHETCWRGTPLQIVVQVMLSGIVLTSNCALLLQSVSMRRIHLLMRRVSMMSTLTLRIFQASVPGLCMVQLPSSPS